MKIALGIITIILVIFLSLLGGGCTSKPKEPINTEKRYHIPPVLVAKYNNQVLIKKVIQATYNPNNFTYRISYLGKDKDGGPVIKTVEYPSSLVTIKTERGDCYVKNNIIVCP